ncbi:MAG: nucleoid-associated protein, partial [Candidatus Thiodiazotropha sp.]
KKFLGVIKAEVHSGYEKEVNKKTNEISLKFVEELLLTPGTRLYKTAGFFEKAGYDEASSNLNDKWVVMVSDYQINKAEGKAAAHYFYSDFLGCGYPETSARTTKKFYESTCEFISKMNVSEEKKSNLLNALTTYLKVDTSSTISSSEFAEKYFDDLDVQDTFTSYMKDSGLPDSAFTKEIEHIDSKLKFRKVNFRSNVKITAPSDTFKDLITIETIEGDPDESGSPAEWTKVIIKDRIIKQE